MTNKHWFLLIVVLITGVLMYVKSQSDQSDRELVKEVQQLYDKSEGQLIRIEEIKLGSVSDLTSPSIAEMRVVISEVETSLIVWKENTSIALGQPTNHLNKESRAKLIALKKQGNDLNKQYVSIVEQIEASEEGDEREPDMSLSEE